MKGSLLYMYSDIIICSGRGETFKKSSKKNKEQGIDLCKFLYLHVHY